MWPLIIILVITSLLIVLAGTIIMVKGGKVNRKYSNKLMIARIVCQAGAILLLVILFMATKLND